MESLQGLLFKKSVRKLISEPSAEIASVPRQGDRKSCSSGIQPAPAGDNKDDENEKKTRPRNHFNNYLRTTGFNVRGFDL